MRYQAFLIKYSEIGIKGKNRYIFENILVKQIKYALRNANAFHVRKEHGRIFVEMLEEYDYDMVVGALKTVFGINAICPVVILQDKSYENVSRSVIEFIGNAYGDRNFTFKVEGRRSDKSYPLTSPELEREIGSDLLEAYPELKVDIRKPQVMVNIEIRNQAYVYAVSIPGPKGMAVGSNGKAMLLLSGGIDSPVAGYMTAKRGVSLEAVYFHAPPYTSERAKQKVVDLAEIISPYTGPIRLHVVNFTDIQLAIYEKCPHDELTVIMRRYMMRIAEYLAKDNGALALITGESIGQVASQTVQNLAATNAVCTLPVFRPLIAFDKQEIVDIAEKIDTYETSIQPYEDCCTIFVAKHPVTKANLNAIERSERKLNECIEALVKSAIETTEVIEVGA